MFRATALRRTLRRSTGDSAGDSLAGDLSELRRHALACEADNRIPDAIQAWTGLNRLRSDAAVEAHLVDLRCDRSNHPSAKPVEPWPRPVIDPFPEVYGRPPEIDASDLSLELLAGAILHHGCLLVRNLFQQDDVDALRATIDQAFAARQQALQGTPIDETTPWYVPCAEWDARQPAMATELRRLADDCRALHGADSPRALFQIIEALSSSNVVEVISEYLGEFPVLSVHKTVLRRVPPDADPAFHQDGSFMGAETRAVDIWVALTECGEGTDAPGLVVLPRRLETTVRSNAREEATWPLRADEVDATGDGIRPAIPTCRPGDALLFDQLLLHGTGGRQPGLDRERYTLEAWMFTPSSAPAGYVPILL